MIKKHLSDRSGAILLMALTLLSVVFIMILSLNASVSFNLNGTAKFLKQTQAEFLAQAGLEKAFWQIKTGPSFSLGMVQREEQTLLFEEPRGRVSYKIDLFHSPEDLLKSQLISTDIYENILPKIRSESEFYGVKLSVYLGMVEESGARVVGTSIITKSNSGVKVVFKKINNG